MKLLRWLLRGGCLLALLVACAAVAHRSPTTQRAGTTRDAPATGGLYAAEDALRDALVGPWQYVGTGKWPGIDRMHACVFKNPRVFIVSVYCGVKDRPAIRVAVYSPTRGRTSIYAEGKGNVSALSRASYFTFLVESAPVQQIAGPELDLSMSFEALRDYEARRYGAFVPVCYAGEERGQPSRGCLDALAPREAEWLRLNAAFLAQPGASWTRMVREMREAGARYGHEP